MPKLPDFSELTKKLDIQGLVDSVKSAVSGSSTPPKAPEGDEVAAKFVEIIALTQNLAKAVSTINDKLNILYKDLQLLKETTTSTTTTETKTIESTAVEPNPSAPTKEDK